MARNEGVNSDWSQQRSTSSKGQSGFIRGMKSKHMDDFGDIMNLLSGCNKGHARKEQWPIHSSTLSSQSYSAPDCCLKNGRIQCSCSLSNNNYLLNRRSYGKSLGDERKLPFWQETGHPGGVKIAEEYVLDDNKLRFDFYDMPFDIPKKKQQLRKVGKVKSVSIIDTLSELASGATDREDEGGFSSVSESAILGPDIYHPRIKHSRHSSSRKEPVFKEHCLIRTPMSNDFSLKANHWPHLSENANNCHSSICAPHVPDIHGDSNFSCSSLKGTLKYLQKAVTTNVEEGPRTRRHNHQFEEKDAFRQCFSDSEVREVPKPWSTIKRTKPELHAKSKSRSLLTVSPPRHTETLLRLKNNFVKSRQRVDVPEWIKRIFSAARNGELDKLKEGLRDMDPSLVRNLSDDHGNNLWHICSSQNYVHCLEWLCSHYQHHSEALKDENKHGFTPIALAVKHGCLLSVQWLVHNTVSKSQFSGTGNAHSLLHIAAKYGQESIVQWLLSYMNSHEININTCDSEGNTPLHLASKHGHINCVKALILRNGNLKSHNEGGLKPIDLAVKYSQVNCADYLLAMEACYNLAAVNLKQQSELQILQKENSEIKEYFKELLTFAKRLQHRQKELVHSITGINHSSQFDSNVSDRKDNHSKYMTEYSHLLASVIADEDQRLAVIEDRWKKSLKPKLMNCKKLPLSVIRSQFTHILNKVTRQSPAVLSTPETSDDSWHSEDEDIPQSLTQSDSAKTIIDSTPDVIHTIPKHHVPNFSSHQKHFQSNKSTSFPNKQPISQRNSSLYENPAQKGKLSNEKLKTPYPASSTRDVNLQMFFKQNPNLRQSGETCSVLEVLEPSSSDSDECLNKINKIHNLNSEDDLQQSSSSSAAETLSPSSCGPCSIRSKKSDSRSSSDGSKREISSSRNANSANNTSLSTGTKPTENKSSDIVNKSADVLSMNHAANFDNSSVEPDLIRGTQKKKATSNMHSLRDDKQARENCNKESVDNPSISTEDSESLEADRSFCSAIDIPEANAGHVPDNSPGSIGNKKKNFLMKFSLRSRWPSKHINKQSSSKHEISAEEFRETYSRSNEISQSPSQNNSNVNFSNQKLSHPPDKDSLHSLENACTLPRVVDNNNLFSSHSEFSRKNMKLAPMGLLPPRREPPPVPPRPSREPQNDEEDMCLGTVNSSPSCMTESAASYNLFASSNNSNLWQSPDSKAMFRPASSASRVEPMSRDESFPLNKSSSASTEVLSALDSSTAGHQSPAPSEVSKTESALSPPSDVSKTESAQHLRQLGRIEESNHLTKESNLQNVDLQEKSANEDAPHMENRSEIKVHKKSEGSRKHNPDKPWYEISDEEDVITPQRYEAMSGRIRSSSEDEEIVAS